MVAGMLGVDIQKDFLAGLGDQWTVYSSPQVGGSGLTGMVVVNQPADAGKLGPAFDKLEAIGNGMIAQNMGGGGPTISIQRTKMGDVDVHSISLFVIAPSWALHDNRLYMALMPQTIPAAVEAANGKTSILDSAGFKSVRARLGVAKPTSVTFIDLPQTATESYPVLAQVLALVNMFAGAGCSAHRCCRRSTSCCRSWPHAARPRGMMPPGGT